MTTQGERRTAPLIQVWKLREKCRKLQARNEVLEAERQGWLAEKARLISALGKRFLDDCPKEQ
jgi:hypothetical protein